jgi:branched-chain amino acid transport system substrate-binding protein
MMEQKPKGIFRIFMMFCAFALLVPAAFAATNEYNISGSVDFTGPYAVVMKPIDDTAKIFFQWWNDTKGKELGIKVNRKVYETRYDPTLVASLWPGILASDKPIAYLGLGGPDVSALMKRLPDDKVPLYCGTATYGFVWLPNQWLFQPRPTYTHEMAGFLNWVRMNKIKDRPIRLAAVSSKAVPAYVDQIDGLTAFAKANPWVQLIGVEWIKPIPVSMVSEIRRLATQKPDFIYIQTNTAHAIGTIRAQKELGIHIPVVLSMHNGLIQCARASGDINLLEGHYEVIAADPCIDMSKEPAVIFETYKKKMGIESEWASLPGMVAAVYALVFRGVERAARMVGPDKINGEAVYKAMFVEPFTEKDLLGLVPTLTFTKEAPFSEKDIKVKIITVKSGKAVMADDNWIPAPPVGKWGKS